MPALYQTVLSLSVGSYTTKSSPMHCSRSRSTRYFHVISRTHLDSRSRPCLLFPDPAEGDEWWAEGNRGESFPRPTISDRRGHCQVQDPVVGMSLAVWVSLPTWSVSMLDPVQWIGLDIQWQCYQWLLKRHWFAGSWRWGRHWATTCCSQSSTTSSSSLSSHQVVLYLEQILFIIHFLQFFRFQTSRRE